MSYTETPNNNYNNYPNLQNILFKCKGTNFNLNSSDPAYQYKNQKNIFNSFAELVGA